MHEKRVPIKLGNVYSEGKHPLDIEKGTRQKQDWQRVVGEESSLPRRAKEQVPVPGPSRIPPPEESSDDGSSNSEDRSTSEGEVRDSLQPSDEDDEEDADLTRLCREGGVGIQKFLISKAVSPTTEGKPHREWKF